MEKEQFEYLQKYISINDKNDLININTDISSDLVNKIYFGDCLELLRKLPDESVDLVVSSPPYNINKVRGDKKPIDYYLEWQNEILKECSRVLKPSGSIFWQVGTFVDKSTGAHIPLDIRFFPMLEDLGLFPKNRIVWIRQHGLHARNKFSGRHETILWFTKTPDYKFFLDPIKVPQKYANKKHWKGDKKGEVSTDPLGKNPGDVWAFTNVRHNHEEDTIHPTQFPEDLVERIILCSTLPGDVVLDPFMGTGTTAVAAKKYDRVFCGSEFNEEYIAVANHRLSGEPDENNNFPNLKTLREYVKTNNIDDPSQFSFTRQRKGSKPSLESKAFTEEHHLEEMVKRIEFEASKSINKVVEQLAFDIDIEEDTN